MKNKQIDPDTNKRSLSTITKQLNKKRLSKKSRKERIADKVQSLAERCEYQSI
jgi:hypothetical protein